MDKTITSTDINGNQYEVPVDQLVWRPAAYGIVVNDDKILLTKQRGKFHLPGGGIELGEMPEDAVLREIREETGLEAAYPKLVGSISGFFSLTFPEGTPPTHVQSILLYYRCKLVGGTLSTDGFEEDEKSIGELAQWIPLEQLDHIEAGSTADWRAVVKSVI